MIEQELQADRYHTGLRLATLGLWFGAIGAIFFIGLGLGNLIFGLVVGVGYLILFLVALFAAQPLAAWGEQQLIARWPSGRAIRLASGRLTMHEKTGVTPFDLTQKVNHWRWRFEIRGRRGGRVPNGHFCFALRLVQGEAAIILYAFFPPSQAKETEARFPFYDLRPLAGQGKIPLGGREAIYLTAEHARWDIGAELTPADFDALLTHLTAHLPEFAVAPNS